MIEKLLLDKYGLIVEKIEKSSVGAGSDTYFITCKDRKVVMKFPCESEMNHPDIEPLLCEHLLKRDIPVCKFIRNCEGNFISTDESGRKFHLQEFIDGKTYELNSAPSWLMEQSAQTLGKLHTALTSFRGLPEGIGKSFFEHMTPQTALYSYENTLKIARKHADGDVEADLMYRIDLMKRFPKYVFDLDRLSCRNTHGDYFISQLICGENQINAVIDWTTACIHPAIWEIMRSFVYAAPSCKDGEINVTEFIEYVKNYMKFATLNRYDFEMLPQLFYYQIAVCDYYNQYYNSAADNRDIYLHQAVFSTKLLKWFEKNMEMFSQALLSLSDSLDVKKGTKQYEEAKSIMETKESKSF